MEVGLSRPVKWKELADQLAAMEIRDLLVVDQISPNVVHGTLKRHFLDDMRFRTFQEAPYTYIVRVK